MLVTASYVLCHIQLSLPQASVIARYQNQNDSKQHQQQSLCSPLTSTLHFKNITKKAAKFIEGCYLSGNCVNLLFSDFANKQLCLAFLLLCHTCSQELCTPGFYCVIHLARSYVLSVFAVQYMQLRVMHSRLLLFNTCSQELCTPGFRCVIHVARSYVLPVFVV